MLILTIFDSMVYRVLIAFVLAATFWSCKQEDKTMREKFLTDNWRFRAKEDSVWRPVNIPGNVFTHLKEHDLINHPFKQSNELEIQWVSERFWEYESVFSLTEDELQNQNIELNFQGIDTYADVFVNDQFVLHTNNAFRKWSIDIKSLVKLNNTIRVVFQPTSVHEEREMKKLPYELPEGPRVFTRKGQFQYGWDWGPILNSFSVDKVSISLWNDFKLKDVYVQQEMVNDSIAEFKLEMDYHADAIEELILDVFVNDTLNKSILLKHPKDSISNEHRFFITNPKLWWTHNLGDPYLYDLRFEFRDDHALYASKTIKKGVRTIKLINEPDRDGETFYFELNGLPVFMKGANYIPQHSLQSEVSDKDYDRILNDAVEANMNMLRVWGGGIYEEDVFYDLCDEKGLLVWQDFMFACAMYPGDEDFLNNVRVEAEEQVKRLRNHASIALWCGNNESSEGWNRWGWQIDRGEEEKKAIWNDYVKLFQELLPEVVAQNCETDYWESSPRYGRGNPKYKFEGDAHDWWVWHDAKPFEHFEDAVPRFMSEFGFQAFPSYEAIRYFTEQDSIDINHPAFETHQKHARGFDLIQEYMERDYIVPEKSEDYVYVSQLVQARGITMGIEAHRRAMPYCMGTLYWQLNDCWPVISWSGIDGLGNWKALHYKAKESFENVLVSNRIQNDTLITYLVNDDLKTLEDELSLEIQDFRGNVLWTRKEQVVLDHNQVITFETSLQDLDIQRDQVVLIAGINNQQKIFYLGRPKDLKLINSPITLMHKPVEKGIEITIISDVFHKDVFLYSNVKGKFKDNFFDLQPNTVKKVIFETDDLVDLNIKLKSLNQFYSSEDLSK